MEQMEQMEKALTWKIHNFSKRENVIISPHFLSGGCKWSLRVYPKEYYGSDHLSIFIDVVYSEWLRCGWSRRASHCFVLLNQAGQVLYRTPDDENVCRFFCAEITGYGVLHTLPLTKLREKGFLEDDKLIVHVYMNVVEVVHRGKPTKDNVVFDYNGLPVLSSHIPFLNKIFIEHPYFALGFKPKKVKANTTYATLLINLLKTLSKSPRRLSVAELTKAQNDLTVLTEAGLNLDWLESKLKDVSWERKKALSDGSWIQKLEERVKKLEHDKIRCPQVYSFEFIDFFMKRFFLSCFSVSKY